MRHLEQFLNQHNMSRRFFQKLPDILIDTMTLDDANALAENLAACWSPENLTCDGELSRAQVQAKVRLYRGTAQDLLKKFPQLTIPQWSDDLFDAPAATEKSFIVGDRVSINHAKLGGRAVGTVLKVNRVKCRVEFPSAGTFNVPFSMMEKV